MKRLLLILSIIFVFSIQEVYAVDNGNGVDVTNLSYMHSWGFKAVWYTSFDPTSTSYVYNEAGGTATNSGLLACEYITHTRTLFVEIPTLNSTSITVRAEVKPVGSTIWHEAYTQVFSAATTIGEIWPILEYSGDFRVGLLVIGDVAGDVVNISGEFMTGKGL